jgi:PPOX class probable F420-dependent enzyme
MIDIHPIYRTRRGLDDAAVEILDRERRAILGTENPDGSVHVTPVMFLFESGRFHIETSAATRKARNIGSRPRATVLVLDQRADGTAWVCGTGDAEVVRGEPARLIGRRIRGRYLTELGEEHLGSVLARYDDVALVVTPQSWLAWDMAALNATMVADGVRLDDSENWFRPDTA